MLVITRVHRFFCGAAGVVLLMTCGCDVGRDNKPRNEQVKSAVALQTMTSPQIASTL